MKICLYSCAHRGQIFIKSDWGIYDSFHWKCHPLQKPGKINFGNRGRHVPLRHVPLRAPGRDGRSTNARGGVLQSRRSRRARAEARAPMRGSSRVCRGVWRSRRCPARCAALRGAARRRGAARSSCAAAGCWCPAPAPPPSRGRCAQQPRAAGALCPLRRRAAGRAVAATAAPHLPARSGLTRGNADSAATTPRSNTPLFLAA